MEDFVCKAAIERFCTEENIEYPQCEISPKTLCHWFKNAVEDWQHQWKRDQEQKTNRKLADKNARAAKTEEEATLQTEAVAAAQEQGHNPNGRVDMGKGLKRSTRILGLRTRPQPRITNKASSWLRSQSGRLLRRP